MRERARVLAGNRITQEGELLIRANRYRTQERNKQDALNRLKELLARAAVAPKRRKKTKLSRAVKERRLEKKKLHGKKKMLRGRLGR